MDKLTNRLEALSPAKRAALEKALIARGARRASAERIPKAPAKRAETLSFAEQRLWLLDQIEPNHPFYNMPLAARLEGPLDQAAFSRALQQIVDRHETLRYAYKLVDGQPRRKVLGSAKVTPRIVDLSESPPTEEELNELLRKEARVPFDLDQPPLLRCIVYELSDQQRIVLLVMHHIVSDGWSMWVMLSELAAAYRSERQACQPAAIPPQVQYSDYAVWQRDRLDGEFLEKQADYWRTQLAQTESMLELPTDFPRSPVQDFDGATKFFELPADFGPLLKATSERTGTTPFMILMAAYQAWLSRYTGQHDLCVGTVVAGRDRAELEGLIGFFVNTLAIRSDLSDDPTFHDLLKQVRETTLGAFDHSELPFDKLIEAVLPDRDRSHAALFQTAMVVQNPPRDFSHDPSLTVTPMPVDNGTAKYDLTFFFWEDAEKWVGQVEYRTTLFNPETISRFLATFEVLLLDALTSPEKTVSRLALLDDADREAITEWNNTDRPVEPPLLIHHQVEQWFSESPDSVAVVHQGSEHSFKELDECSRTLAAGLQRAGVEKDEPVVVCLPRSFESVAAMLAVWRAGGVYVPVDAEQARQRLPFVAGDCKARVAIVESATEDLEQALKESKAKTELTTCEILSKLGKGKKLRALSTTPTDRAYVIYTSGSTGRPKGVEIEHRMITNFIQAQTEKMGVTAEDRIQHAFSPAFDGGLSEQLLALRNGAALVIVDRTQTLDPKALTQLLCKERVTLAKFPPALLSTLNPKDLPYLKTLSSAGDTLTGELAQRWCQGRRFFNGYGPTEATVGVSMYEITGNPPPKPPIGPPMAGTRAYVLDAHQQMVPIGVAGEIVIGGTGVARGYLNRPEETAAQFLADPFSSDPGARMYRTGDRGRWRSDGVLEFLGRVDDQVQLRGYRVEPGEVTAALENLPEVKQAYTCVQSDTAGEERLVAYVVPTPQAAAEGAQQLEANHLASWQSLMTQSHQAVGALRDLEFDTTGWVSTFTGKPIPKQEMRSWATSTAERVLELEPKHVLEIGCGGGLILLQVAPQCQSYVGTDFLARSLKQLGGVLQRKDEPWTDRVELFEQAAHELGAIEGRKFDTIVLNSVVQYFPSVDYLLRVIHQATQLLEPGGRIFLGDIRNLRLQETMAAAVEFARADAYLSRRELISRIETRVRNEGELLVDASFFQELKQELPRLSRHTVQLKRGPAENELIRFRYDVTLEFDGSAPPTTEWEIDSTSRMTAADFASRIAERPTAAAIRGLTSSRVAEDFAAWDILRTDESYSTAGELRSELNNDRECGSQQDPDAWRDELHQAGLGAEYEIEVCWSAVGKPDQFDVIVRNKESLTNDLLQTNTNGHHKREPHKFVANSPLEEKKSAAIAPRLREGLAEQLPQYMIPAAFVLMEGLPRTVQGKVDREALPPPPSGRPAWATGYVEPQNELERLVANVWEDLLGFSPIGSNDDFFELGGHSMLAVRAMGAIEKQVGYPVPLAALFQEPTVRHLASVIADQSVQDPESVALAGSLIPLQSAGDAPPLFCIHPAGGTVFCYRDLANHFAGERPVIGIQAVGVDGQRPPHETMAEMAAHYAAAIRSHTLQGPYHVCGWSLGGNIAYAVAAELEQQGAEVGTVALFDAGATPPEESLAESDLMPLLGALFPNLEHIPLEELRQLTPEEQVTYFTERAVEAGLVDGMELAASKHVFNVFQKNVGAVHQHTSGSYGGEITLLRAAEQEKTNALFDDPQLGWGGLAASVEVIEVSSDHNQMMSPPQVDQLAALLRAALLRTESSHAIEVEASNRV